MKWNIGQRVTLEFDSKWIAVEDDLVDLSCHKTQEEKYEHYAEEKGANGQFVTN